MGNKIAIGYKGKDGKCQNLGSFDGKEKVTYDKETEGFSIDFVGGVCPANPKKKIMTTVRYVCEKSQSLKAKPNGLGGRSKEDPCKFVFKVLTRQACPTTGDIKQFD